MYARMDAADVRLPSNPKLSPGEDRPVFPFLLIFKHCRKNSNTQHNDKRTDSDRCHPEMG